METSQKQFLESIDKLIDKYSYNEHRDEIHKVVNERGLAHFAIDKVNRHYKKGVSQDALSLLKFINESSGTIRLTSFASGNSECKNKISVELSRDNIIFILLKKVLSLLIIVETKINYINFYADIIGQIFDNKKDKILINCKEALEGLNNVPNLNDKTLTYLETFLKSTKGRPSQAILGEQFFMVDSHLRIAGVFANDTDGEVEVRKGITQQYSFLYDLFVERSIINDLKFDNKRKYTFVRDSIKAWEKTRSI